MVNAKDQSPVLVREFGSVVFFTVFVGSSVIHVHRVCYEPYIPWFIISVVLNTVTLKAARINLQYIDNIINKLFC